MSEKKELLVSLTKDDIHLIFAALGCLKQVPGNNISLDDILKINPLKDKFRDAVLIHSCPVEDDFDGN